MTASGRFEANRLRAFPQGALAEAGEILQPRGEGDEVITRQLPHLAGEVHAAIGQ